MEIVTLALHVECGFEQLVVIHHGRFRGHEMSSNIVLMNEDLAMSFPGVAPAIENQHMKVTFGRHEHYFVEQPPFFSLQTIRDVPSTVLGLCSPVKRLPKTCKASDSLL